jgi:hypothetical protein
VNKNLEDSLAENASKALGELLSNKHLYQRTKVSVEFLDAEFARRLSDYGEEPESPYGPPSLEECRADLERWTTCQWSLVLPDQNYCHQYATIGSAKDVLGVFLPTIKTVCANPRCKERAPFNPVSCSVSRNNGVEHEQCFHLEYQCQSCKGPNVHFLVRRSNAKLTLCGRSPIEVVEIDKAIPKENSGFFRDAVIAHNSGQTLAGLFLLRVFVEQFWKSVPDVSAAVAAKTRPTGDELGEAYKATLPNDFKVRFQSLTEIYDDLSAAIHSANADAILFEGCQKQIVTHFEARRLFKIR